MGYPAPVGRRTLRRVARAAEHLRVGDVERRTASGERHDVIDGQVAGSVGRTLVARAPVAVLAAPSAEHAGAEPLPGPRAVQGVVPAAVGRAGVLGAATTSAAGDDTADRAQLHPRIVGAMAGAVYSPGVLGVRDRVKSWRWRLPLPTLPADPVSYGVGPSKVRTHGPVMIFVSVVTLLSGSGTSVRNSSMVISHLPVKSVAALLHLVDDGLGVGSGVQGPLREEPLEASAIALDPPALIPTPVLLSRLQPRDFQGDDRGRWRDDKVSPDDIDPSVGGRDIGSCLQQSLEVKVEVERPRARRLGPRFSYANPGVASGGSCLRTRIPVTSTVKCRTPATAASGGTSKRHRPSA